MPAEPSTTTAPTIEIVGATSEPSDAAVSALARLLLSVADQDNPEMDCLYCNTAPAEHFPVRPST